MKKCLLFLALLLTAFPFLNEAEAKAVKLGRGRSSSIFSGATLGGNNGGHQELSKGECSTDSQCASGKKCVSKKCADVCSSTTCSSGTCVTDPDNSHASKCVDGCYNVTCKSGYMPQETSDGCCCVASSCPSGQRLSNGTCVDNCTGVVCNSGYVTKSDSTGCCCETDTSCQSGYSYSTTYKGCIKDTSVCNSGCAASGCGIGSTTKAASGYYIKADGTCPACSTAIANCATCKISKLGATPTCLTCKTGYTLSGLKCTVTSAAITCPTGCETCSSSTTCTKCSSGYTLSSSGKCISDCDGWDIAYKSCSKGYRRQNGSTECEKCPANTMCPTCPTGCTGSTAGTCHSSQGTTCVQCINKVAVTTCTCASLNSSSNTNTDSIVGSTLKTKDYVLTMDGKTCASISGYYADIACSQL